MSRNITMFSTNELPSYESMEVAIKQVDARYSIDTTRPPNCAFDPASLNFDEKRIASFEIGRPGEELFENETREFIEELENRSIHNERIKTHLQNNLVTLNSQVQQGSGDEQWSTDLLWPLLSWLMSQTGAIIHADGDGFYDQDGLILEFDY